MDEANPISSPMVGGCKLTKLGFEDFSDPTLYRSIVGVLQYATITRPEISFSVNKACQFMSKPSEQHWLSVKRILRYLKGTVNQKTMNNLQKVFGAWSLIWGWQQVIHRGTLFNSCWNWRKEMEKRQLDWELRDGSHEYYFIQCKRVREGG